MEGWGIYLLFQKESIFILLIFAQLLPDVLHFYTTKAETSRRVQHTQSDQKIHET